MTNNTEAVAAVASQGFVKRILGSMWGFWFILLTFSMGAAIAIYYVWLKGTM
jgi:hypothetical protein